MCVYKYLQITIAIIFDIIFLELILEIFLVKNQTKRKWYRAEKAKRIVKERYWRNILIFFLESPQSLSVALGGLRGHRKARHAVRSPLRQSTCDRLGSNLCFASTPAVCTPEPGSPTPKMLTPEGESRSRTVQVGQVTIRRS